MMLHYAIANGYRVLIEENSDFWMTYNCVWDKADFYLGGYVSK
jgi:hypothetical protein